MKRTKKPARSNDLAGFATLKMCIDSKRRKKLRQKKTALGHAEDDHEDWDMKQEL